MAAKSGKVNRTGRNKKPSKYLLLPYSILQHAAWRNQSGAAIKVLLEMCTRYNGGNNGKLVLSHREAKSALGMGNSSISRALIELQES